MFRNVKLWVLDNPIDNPQPDRRLMLDFAQVIPFWTPERQPGGLSTLRIPGGALWARLYRAAGTWAWRPGLCYLVSDGGPEIGGVL
jgi:hypothetical protein